MLSALAHPAYRRLFAAQVVALAGTGVATVALGLLAHDLAGPRAGAVLGTVLTVKMVAYVVLAPLAAALVARLPRRRVLVGADLVRLAAALALPFVGEVWQVLVLVLLLQGASATFTPTFQSVVPDVLPDERDYTAALSLSRLAYDLEAVVSPALAALLLLVLTPAQLFGGTAAGFGASALLVASVALPRGLGALDATPGGAATPGAGDRERFGVRLRRGATLVVRTPALRPVLALNLAVAAAGAFVLVQTVVIARTVLGLGPDGVALLLAVCGGGSVVAALVLPRVLRSRSERRVMLGGAVLLTAGCAVVPLVLAAPPGAVPAVVCVAWVAIGAGWSAVETPVGRVVRRSVDRRDLHDAFAAQFSSSHACWLVTYLLAGWVGVLGVAQAATVLALVAAAATFVAHVLWRGTGGAPGALPVSSDGAAGGARPPRTTAGVGA
ncbi:MFS transporter [Oerskovia jenensis]|uniref:MFS family arabinose efflux permease n=1 Tax=Oerskovia jenensis TaxID=162169 RepID=A0ABS2LAE7_9CELL|nr:MFS transporter [Oerskovia jenensis]MBM7477375.1 putative MFS family arabinose efflux permease [Oerskovia jenensis]